MSEPNYLTKGDCLPPIIYIQFSIKIHTDDGSSYEFLIGPSNTDVTSGLSINLCRTDGKAQLSSFSVIDQLHALVLDSTNDLTLDEWHTVEIAILSVANCNSASGYLDRVGFAPHTSWATSPNQCFVDLQSIYFGAMAGGNNDHYVKDINIGTGGFGSSNLFRFNHLEHLASDSVIPPFDSIVGDGMTLDSTGMRFQTSGADVYVKKELSFP